MLQGLDQFQLMQCFSYINSADNITFIGNTSTQYTNKLVNEDVNLTQYCYIFSNYRNTLINYFSNNYCNLLKFY